MSNDSKLALVLGVSLVILIGLVFFPRTPDPAAPASAPPTVIPTERR